MLGLTEPRYVFRANLRLWLVHVKESDPQQKAKRRRVAPSPAPPLVPCSITLTREDPMLLAKKACLRLDHVNLVTESLSSIPSESSSQPDKDFYFFPQPWVTETGLVKPSLFTHLIKAVCSTILRMSGTVMERLAWEYRFFLSPVSFRIFCFLLQDLKLIRIFRATVASSSTSLFSKPSAVEYSTDRNLLAPANELTVRLEPTFVSRCITACECFAECIGVTPDSPHPYVSFTTSRNPRRSTVLKRKEENTDAPDSQL